MKETKLCTNILVIHESSHKYVIYRTKNLIIPFMKYAQKHHKYDCVSTCDFPAAL